MTNSSTLDVQKAFEKIVDFLGVRDHSQKELRQKLLLRGVALPIIEAALLKAEEYRLLPDETLMAQKATLRLSQIGKSPAQIRVWLKKRGLPMVDMVTLSEDEAPVSPLELEKIALEKVIRKTWNKSLLQAKKASLKLEKESRRSAAASLDHLHRDRILRATTQRGFSLQTAQSVYARILAENPLK